MQTAGFVLVGGNSRRMGRDKALLPWKSGLLVEHVAAVAASVTDSVALVGDPARYGRLGMDCLPDKRPGLGPLAGIETALESGRAEWNLVLACDMPQIAREHLLRLFDAARSSRAQCIVTSDSDGVFHPLCGVYRATCLPRVSKALDEKKLKLATLVSELDAAVVRIDSRLWNVNTSEEWERVNTIDGE